MKTFTFPGGERHVQLDGQTLSEWGPNVFARIKSSDHLMDLLLHVDILNNRGVNLDTLSLPYFPYARQDRYTDSGSPFSLRVVANLINDLQFRRVKIYEPHSVVTESLVKRCSAVYMTRDVLWYLEKLYSELGIIPILVSPDAGASKRVEKLNRGPFVQILKHRDPVTGRVEISGVYSKEKISGKDLLIVDDICDGGATFIQAAERLRDMGAKSLRLIVAHGIFSKGLRVLKPLFDGVCCSDSWCDLKSDNYLTVYPTGLEPIRES